MLDESAGAVDAMLDAGSWMLDEVDGELFFIFPIYVRVRRSYWMLDPGYWIKPSRIGSFLGFVCALDALKKDVQFSSQRREAPG
jgi:hypothetical protein